MSRDLLKFLLIATLGVTALGIFAPHDTIAAESGLTGATRNAFVNNAIKTCFEKQVAAPENKTFSVGLLRDYCTCYANSLANLISPDELRGYSGMINFPADLQRKIDSVAHICLGQ